MGFAPLSPQLLLASRSPKGTRINIPRWPWRSCSVPLQSPRARLVQLPNTRKRPGKSVSPRGADSSDQINCLWLGGDALICTYGNLDWITWLAYAVAYMLAAPIGASLSLTFAIRFWVYVLLSLLCWPSYAAIVVIAKVPQDQSIAQTQWLIGMLLFVSWVMSIVFYAVFDTHARALYSLTRQNHDLAMAKSRYTAAISHDFNTPLRACGCSSTSSRATRIATAILSRRGPILL